MAMVAVKALLHPFLAIPGMRRQGRQHAIPKVEHDDYCSGYKCDEPWLVCIEDGNFPEASAPGQDHRPDE
jgi:hypothetical protein